MIDWKKFKSIIDCIIIDDLSNTNEYPSAISSVVHE